MRTLKVLTEFLKQVNAWKYDSDIWTVSDGGFEGDDEYIVLMRGSFMALRFRKFMFPFDLENHIVKDYYRNNLNFEEMTKETSYIPAVYSGTCRETEATRGKKKGVMKKIVATNKPERYAWVNQVYLDYFHEPTFALSDTEHCQVSLVRIYEGGELVGIVCPIRVKEEA